MNKPLFVFSGPVDIFAGYGAKARDIILSIIKSNKYEVRILPQRWGGCAKGFLKADVPDHKLIMDCIMTTPQLDRQPDVWAQCTVPNEMQKFGKYNILFTSGIETNLCDATWIEGCNRADLVIACSEHAKKVFEESKFEERDQRTNQIKRVIELTTKVEVLFEGINTEIYKKLDVISGQLNDTLNSIPENFCYLFVGHWLQGDLGQDRKDVGGLVKTFLETFKGVKNAPALILKVNGASYSILDQEDMLHRIQTIRDFIGGKDLPNVYMLHGELTDSEMNILYNHPKVKAMANFTKGEGFGRPLLEFSVSQKPIIVSNWSGHLDFLKPDSNILLPGSMTPIHKSAQVQNMLIEGSSWFTVNYKNASKVLEDVWKTYKNYVDLGKKQAYHSRTNYSLEVMGNKLDSILEQNVPKTTALKLPSMSLPKLKMIKNDR